MKIRNFIAGWGCSLRQTGFLTGSATYSRSQSLFEQVDFGQALRSPIRFVARSSADEWDDIIPYNRNQPD